jgi:hypothetical protein
MNRERPTGGPSLSRREIGLVGCISKDGDSAEFRRKEEDWGIWGESRAESGECSATSKVRSTVSPRLNPMMNTAREHEFIFESQN